MATVIIAGTEEAGRDELAKLVLRGMKKNLPAFRLFSSSGLSLSGKEPMSKLRKLRSEFWKAVEDAAAGKNCSAHAGLR